MNGSKVLIYGYGNIGRQDDGLGVYFAEEMEKWKNEKNIKKISINTDYQLNIEDSLLMTESDFVIFADASNSGSEFNIRKLVGIDTLVSFSTHKIDPDLLVYLCKELYNKSPTSYLITIRGYEWGFCQELSKNAKINLERALSFAQNTVHHLL